MDFALTSGILAWVGRLYNGLSADLFLEVIIIEVRINKEVRDYQESIFFGLSLRQLIFALLAVLVAVGVYFGLRNVVGSGEIGWICVLAAFPFALGGEVINISATSKNHINALDMEQGYGDGDNPVVLKSEFLLSLCEQLVGSGKLSAKEKSIIDRCTAQCYREYVRGGYRGAAPTLQDFYAELLRQPEPEARDVALAIELFTEGSLNTFAKPTNVDTDARILCYDIRDLGKQLLPVGMLVVLDSVFNRCIRNRQLGRNTWIYIDEIYMLFQHEYSANFLFTLWKRVRKYGALCSGLTQNVDDLLQSHTARTMLANSEFLVMLNQAGTDRAELASLLNISDNQLSYITNVDAGRGLIKCGSAIVPFVNNFPKNTRLYRLMSTRFTERMAA